MKKFSARYMLSKFLTVLAIAIGMLPVVMMMGFGYHSEMLENAKKRHEHYTIVAHYLLSQQDVKKHVDGLATEASKQPFEDHMGALLYLSLNDDMGSGYRGIKWLKMSERKKYFTDVAWGDYQKYLAKREITLEGREDTGKSPRSLARFFHGSQEYSEHGDKKYFTAQGYYCYSSAVSYFDCLPDQFTLSVVVTGDFQKPEDMVIERWEVGMGKVRNEHY